MNYYTENSKIAQAHITAYEQSEDWALWQVYGRYSQAKENAMQYCVDLMHRLDGWGIRILSHNCMMFTVGFCFNDPDTGVLRFAYITRDYDRFCNYV